jgi:beta-glucosidase
MKLVATGARIVLVLAAGSPLALGELAELAEAVVYVWYPGQEGGHAVADVLTGRANPSGKLPCTFPRSARQLPPFDPAALEIEYGYYHGYRLMDQTGEKPAFPFGFGLSYTTFAYHNLRLAQDRLGRGDILVARVDVTNTGARPGVEVAQLYIGCPGRGVDRPRRELKGFARLSLAPGETQAAEMAVPVSDLAYYDEASASWVVEEGDYVAYAGPWAREEDLLRVGFKVS